MIDEMHRARREHEQEFGRRRQSLFARVQDQVANFLGERRTAGLASDHMGNTARGESLRDVRDLSGFPHTFDTLDGQEASRHRADSAAAF